MGRVKKGGFLHYTAKGAWFLLKTFLRGLRIILAVVLILCLLGFFGAKHLFNEDRVKAFLVTQLGEMFHRPVQIGSVVLTPSGMKLRDVQVIERLDVPGQYLLTSEVALVTLKLRPLLDRRLELDSVKLVAPTIQLIRDADGSWNVADIFSSTRTHRSVPMGRFTLPVSLAAESTVIQGGIIKVEDRFKHTSYYFDKVDLTVRQFDTDLPFTFDASFDNVNTVSSRTISTSWKLEGSMTLASFDWKAAYLRAERAEVLVDDSLLRGSLGLSGFQEPVVDVDLAAPALGPAQWERYLGKTLDLSLPASRWRLKVAFPAPHEMQVRRLQLDAPPLALTASGRIDLSKEKPLLKAVVESGVFPLAKAASLHPAWAPYNLGGTAQGKVEVEGPLDRLQVAEATLALRDLGATFSKARVLGGDVVLEAAKDFSKVRLTSERALVEAFGNSFRDVSGSLTLQKQDLKLETLSVRWNDSSISLKARVLNISDPKEVAIVGTIDKVRWEEAQALVVAVLPSTRTVAAPDDEDNPKPWLRIFKYVIPKKFPDIVGEISVGSVLHKNFSFERMDLLWDVRGISPALDHVSGDVKVGFGPGRVNDIPAVQDSHKFLRIVFLPFIYMHKMNNLSVFSTNTAYPKTLDFSRIEGEYGIQSGLATTRCFYVDSPQVVAYAEGTADLGKELVDMNILTRLTTYRDPLPEWWTDELGRPAIGFHVLNDLNKPDLDPRLSKMAADEIERAVANCKTRSKLRQGTLARTRAL